MTFYGTNRQRFQRAGRGAAVGLVGLAFLVLASSTAVTESVLSHFPEYSPILRLLPRYEGQSGNPDLRHLGTPIDIASIRRAGKLVPDDALYYVQAPEPLAEDVRRVARLYLLPSFEVREPSDARWILAYRSNAPPGIEVLKPLVLSRDVLLIRVARR